MSVDLFEAPDYFQLDELLSEEQKLVRDTTRNWVKKEVSPIIENKIQTFPWETWRNEFSIANKIGLKIMEWTLDYKDLYKNPLMTDEGKKKINKLSKKFNLSIPSLTGDCFMQAPFWKSKNYKRLRLQNDFINIVQASSKVGIKKINPNCEIITGIGKQNFISKIAMAAALHFGAHKDTMSTYKEQVNILNDKTKLIKKKDNIFFMTDIYYSKF